MQVKDGAAWAALEYTKWREENNKDGRLQNVRIIPVAIVYTNKSKYRSSAILEYDDIFFPIDDTYPITGLGPQSRWKNTESNFSHRKRVLRELQ